MKSTNDTIWPKVQIMVFTFYCMSSHIGRLSRRQSVTSSGSCISSDKWIAPKKNIQGNENSKTTSYRGGSGTLETSNGATWPTDLFTSISSIFVQKKEPGQIESNKRYKFQINKIIF